MPTPEQLREQRIRELFSEFNGQNVTMIDPILRKVYEKWPAMKPRTAKEYAIAVLRMLKAETKKK